MWCMFGYQDYKNKVLEILREKYGEDVVRETTVTKNNNTKLEGIILHVGTSAASPIIYFDSRQNVYTDLDVKGMVRTAEEQFKVIKHFTDKAVEDARNWKKMQTRIFPKVIHYEKNKEMLMKTPHVRFLDLAVVFFYQTNEMFPELGEGTVMVHDGMKNVWDVNEEQLMKYSMKNLKEMKCACKKMDEFAEMCGISDEEEALVSSTLPLYILTTYDGMFGAAAMLNRKFMEKACKKMQCQKLWVIPSSIHEVLLLPYDYEIAAKNLQGICVDVNKTLNPEDILSDSIYVYDDAEKQIDFADVRGNS